MLKDFLDECGVSSLKELEKAAKEVLENPPAQPLKSPAPLHLLTSGSAPPPTLFVQNPAGSRVEWYLGPDFEVRPKDLDKFEASKAWVIEPKYDGMWAMLLVGDPQKGKPHVLKSRDAKTGTVGGANAGDLVEVPLGLPEGTILAGELEAATEASTALYHKHGFRRMHIFDCPRGTEDYRALPWVSRRELLEMMVSTFSAHAQTRLPLVPYFEDKFRWRYEQWLADGMEGCVLKLRSSLYKTPRTDGKTDNWLRCKKRVTEDYVLWAVGKTPGGQPTGEWGLYQGKKLVRVMQARCPEKLLVPENVGTLVAEFMGWARFASGALRHAQFVRVREDKPAEDCVLHKKKGEP